ncbi:vegetative incompatibility protein het-e-1 [Fusarium austroafricanum]|uniref:Vegetative incompatibility protein het-e-1 n=1 Tax=Fusarium austroafricanum TaxID=2364996 RepID=A0A8H4KNJ2_9HYPO|nr:vegetative incompatibility protein het-e-1 [Fusarium austroafricanum]
MNQSSGLRTAHEISLATYIQRLINDAPNDQDVKTSFVEYFWGSVEQYYDEMRLRLLEYCKAEIKVPVTFESRVKSQRSIRKSIERREKAGELYDNLGEIIRDVHDLMGIRIIVDFTPHLEDVNKWVERTFRQDKKPNVFSAERESGHQWTAWFGAYQCWNHHISIIPGGSSDLEPYREVMFEIQITCLSERLYNKLAHPLLYKGAPGSISRKDEMVIDMAHSMSLCYSMCLLYFQDELQDPELINAMKQAASSSSPKINNGKDGSSHLIELMSQNKTFSPKIPLSFLKDGSLQKKINRQDLVSLLDFPHDELASKDMIWAQMRNIVEEAIHNANKPQIFLPEVPTARFDNKEIQESPRCHEGTRISILRDIESWINDTKTSETMLWLFGPAGTGKSTIACTVASQYESEDMLAASYFFRRGSEDSDRNGTARLFPTIANQLAVYIPRFRVLLAHSLKQSHCKPEETKDRGLEKQFDMLIQKPLSGLHMKGNKRNVIVIDALDECNEIGNIRHVVELFSSLRGPAQSWLRVVFTSREAIPIRITFQTLHYISLPLQGGSVEETERDIEKYLETNLARIKTEKSIEGEWPQRCDLEALVRRATSPSPLFIYAATFLRYIHNEQGTKDTIRLFQRWMRQCDQKMSQLGALYRPILEDALPSHHGNNDDDDDCDDDGESDLMKFLAAIACAVTPLSTKAWSAFLSISLNSIKHWLGNLHPVLHQPGDHDESIKIIHDSFRDYLLSKKGPGESRFRQDFFGSHFKLAEECVKRLSQTNSPFAPLSLIQDVHKPQDLGMEQHDRAVFNLRTCINDDLKYACRHWCQHWLESTKFDNAVCGKMESFIRQHIISWVEILAIMYEYKEALYAIYRLRKKVMEFNGQRSSPLSDVLTDVQTFLVGQEDILAEYPLQTCLSALAFWPSNSQIKPAPFATQLHFIRNSMGEPSQWLPQLKQVIHGHRDNSCFAVSVHDQILLQHNYHGLELWDAREGVCLRKYTLLEGEIIDVAFCQDGKSFVSICSQGQIVVWDTETGCRRSQSKFEGLIVKVAISAVQSLLVVVSEASSQDGLARLGLWDFEGEKDLGELNCGRRRIYDFADIVLSPDGTKVAVHMWSDKVFVWDTITKVCYRSLDLRFEFSGPCICFSACGEWLVAATNRNSLTWWKFKSDICQTVSLPSGYIGKAIKAISFLPRTNDFLVMDWSTTNSGSKTFHRPGQIKAIALSSNNRTVATSSDNHTLLLWDLQSKKGSLDLSKRGDLAAETMTFSPDGKFLAVLSGNRFEVWRIDIDSKPILKLDSLLPDFSQVDDHSVSISGGGTFSKILIQPLTPGEGMSLTLSGDGTEWNMETEIRLWREGRWALAERSISCSREWISYTDCEGFTRDFFHIPYRHLNQQLACNGNMVVMGNFDGELAMLDFDLELLEQYSQDLSNLEQLKDRSPYISDLEDSVEYSQVKLNVEDSYSILRFLQSEN